MNKIPEEVEQYVRKKYEWNNLPLHIKGVFQHNYKGYEAFIFNYSLRNQLRYRGNLVKKIYKNEQRYYETLVERSIINLNIFPYHLGDMVTKGLRVTPFNYYIDVLSYMLKNDKSYDTLPNFTAADCLRIIGIGRNEYLSLIGVVKTSNRRFFKDQDPKPFLPKVPVFTNILPFWRVELAFVIEDDIRDCSLGERALLDDLIDFGSQTAGILDYTTVLNLYNKGLIYLDVPINGEDIICIPQLRNFVMNRTSGDYFEQLLYKIFVTADEHMTISELAQLLDVDLDMVKAAVSLLCRLGFAYKKTEFHINNIHETWKQYFVQRSSQVDDNQVTILNPPREFIRDPQPGTSSNQQQNRPTDLPLLDINRTSPIVTSPYCKPGSVESLYMLTPTPVDSSPPPRLGKKFGFVFDSTLTAFLMMGNLSPGLKSHAVTMFEVGKLCDESMEEFLRELDKIVVLDAEGGEVGRYFTHAVILRSTLIALRSVSTTGVDLLRLECLENLDPKTRDKILDKKYKSLIAMAPLTGHFKHVFTIPFFGPFYKCVDFYAHMWSRLFYYHLSGFGPPTLYLVKGTFLKTLPRIFLGYGKLLVTIPNTEPYVLNSENYNNLNVHLKNGCILVQGYGIRDAAEIRYQAFPFNKDDAEEINWMQHRAITRVSHHINLENTCGYITFVNTKVPDIGCDDFQIDVRLEKPKIRKTIILNGSGERGRIEKRSLSMPVAPITDLLSPIDPLNEITAFNQPASAIEGATSKTIGLHAPGTSKMYEEGAVALPSSGATPGDDTFVITPMHNKSPANIFRSDDCNELIEKELNMLEIEEKIQRRHELVSQSSVELLVINNNKNGQLDAQNGGYRGEAWTLLDITFGIPLFDVDCNSRICQQLTKDLLTDKNLAKLRQANDQMNDKFMKFISQCMYFVDEDMEYAKMGELIPPPRLNLAFENGKVCYWPGK